MAEAKITDADRVAMIKRLLTIPRDQIPEAVLRRVGVLFSPLEGEPETIGPIQRHHLAQHCEFAATLCHPKWSIGLPLEEEVLMHLETARQAREGWFDGCDLIHYFARNRRENIERRNVRRAAEGAPPLPFDKVFSPNFFEQRGYDHLPGMKAALAATEVAHA